jgi:hypothetical protein
MKLKNKNRCTKDKKKKDRCQYELTFHTHDLSQEIRITISKKKSSILNKFNTKV